MKFSNIKYISIAALLSLTVISCSDDDDTVEPGVVVERPDFSGTFAQQDQAGRPGINTVFTATGELEDSFNVTIPSEQTALFATPFLDRLNGLHAAFGADYETNILGLDGPALTTFLATDVLQVAPNEPTTYFDGTNILTGRNITDDVIDISLILLFGGESGARFDGQNGTPILVTDGVDASGETPLGSFPYLEVPHSL